MSATPEARATWSSRPAFLFATIGGAVGLGNLWRFPFITGENGGGGFVLIYVGIVALIGLPVLAGEMLLGRLGRKSAIGSIADIVRAERAHPFWRAIGWGSLFVPFVGFTYYAVVAAWSLDYLALAAVNAFDAFDAATSEATFGERSARALLPVVLHGVFVAGTAFAIARGINAGIERMARVMMPALFLMLVVLVIYGALEGDLPAAARFLFAPDFSAIDGDALLAALGQALFSVGIGAGLMITYASYMPRNFSLRRSATVICIGDTLVAILAGFAIFPMVFEHGLDAAEGPGLIFVTLPIAFGNMPGGHLFGTVFFVLLLFAAYTSSLAMLEPTVAWLEERFPGRRTLLTWTTAAVTWLIGIGSVLSFGLLSEFQPLAVLGIERTLFGLADFSVANLMLPLNALLIAAFCGWVLSARTVRREFAGDSRRWHRLWRVVNRYVAPVAIAAVLIDLVT